MMITYWTTTTLIALLLLASAGSYMFSDATIQGIAELGFPPFFRIQLAVLKLIAAVVLVLPQAPIYAKEWAYAGVGLFLLTAIVAHAANRDPIAISLLNIGFFAILIASNVSFHRLVAT